MNPVSNDPLDFPPELCSKPTVLIGLYGLDINTNPLHRSIWEQFSKNQDRSKINLKLLGNSGQNFPPVKPKKTSYEKYIPKGLLKRNWMIKHMLKVPGTAAFLFELNWDDPNWEQLKGDCVNKFQIFKSSFGGHTTKLGIILLQRTPPLPAAEDIKAAERAKALCSACDIETKHLFVLPHGDHLQGYIVRLENALYELAQSYYQHKILTVKHHKDNLNKYTHQYLFVRHQFKIAFLLEMKQDIANAKRSYEAAYCCVREVRMSDTNLMEVKLVAGFINYKLCQLMFRASQPRDAISQLRSHIDFFMQKVGPKELLFEHYAWISKQYTAFGDLFDDAIRHGLVAVQTQHPGFYYKLAAQHSIDRKKACMDLCSNVTSYPEVDPLTAEGTQEFFGQRPWRPGKLSAEPVDPALEQSGIQALKFKEKSFDHSSLIISQLGNAISQFKTYKCPRMRLQLVVQMANEYYSAKEYGKALTLLSHMIWDYRSEKWWDLLSILLTRALSCAFLSASVHDYIVFAMEALGPCAKFSLKEKERIFNNLMLALKMKTPEPEHEISPQDITAANALWMTANSGQPISVPVEMNNVSSCVEAKARFSKKEFAPDELITVEIYIRLTCPCPLEFSHVSVGVSSPNFTSEFAVSSENSSLLFEPGVARRLLCEFHCNTADAGKELQIGFILLTVGSPAERSVLLKYVGGDSAAAGKLKEFERLRLNAASEFDSIEPLVKADILSEPSKIKLSIQHDSPALLGEWYPINLHLTNQETVIGCQNISLDVRLQLVGDDHSLDQSTQLCDKLDGGPVLNHLNLSVVDIAPSQSTVVTVYLKGHRVGDRTLLIKLTYTTSDKEIGQACMVEDSVLVPIIKPFEVTSEVLSMKFEQLVRCFAHDAFILSPRIQITSPWPLKIHHSTVELGLLVKSCDSELSSHLEGTELRQGETGTDMFALHIDEASEQAVALGCYVLRWSRLNSNSVTSSSVVMPTVRCDPCPVGVEMTIPAHGWVRKPMDVEYRLKNHTSTLLELDLEMEGNDAFMFAGQKKVLLRLLPDSVRRLEYSMYPLFSGLVALPRLMLSAPDLKDYSEQLKQVIERNLPSHVYVMPRDKINSSVIGI